MVKAIVLLSGGLDSTLAIKLMLDQGIEIEALNFSTFFCQCTSKKSACRSESRKVAERFGLPLKVIDNNKAFFKVIKSPPHGYGRNMNPCIDCRILMLKTAGDYMKESGASFLVTGEVLGQRPMSQHRQALKLIEKETGLTGLILRPLSAQALEPTIPEKKGWVDREKLPAITGRSRKEQMNLAKMFEIKDYPCPAGGCLLTDPGFSRRLKDFLTDGELTVNEGLLLKQGRHFRIGPKARAVVGRNETENKMLLSLVREGDLIVEVKVVPGPITILRGDYSETEIKLAGSITARYADLKGDQGEVEVKEKDNQTVRQTFSVTPLTQSGIKQYLVGAALSEACCGDQGK